MEPSETDRKVLAEDGPPSKRLVIQLSQIEDNRFLDLRYWYQDKKTGEFRPTAKGVALTRKNYLVIKRLVDEKSESILDWLNLSYVPEHVLAYDNRQAATAAELQYSIPNAEVSVETNSRMPSFFEVRSEGGAAEVALNDAHPFTSSFLEAIDDGDPSRARQLLAQLLLCHERARNGLMASPSVHASVLLDQLDFDWSQMLKKSVSGK